MGLTRRGILKAMGAAGIAPGAIAGQIGVGTVAAAVGDLQGRGESMEPAMAPDWFDRKYSLAQLIDPDRFYGAKHYADMAPHIAGRRSWSAAFKHHLAEKEIREARALADLIRRLDQGPARALLQALGEI